MPVQYPVQVCDCRCMKLRKQKMFPLLCVMQPQQPPPQWVYLGLHHCIGGANPNSLELLKAVQKKAWIWHKWQILFPLALSTRNTHQMCMQGISASVQGICTRDCTPSSTVPSLKMIWCRVYILWMIKFSMLMWLKWAPVLSLLFTYANYFGSHASVAQEFI